MLTPSGSRNGEPEQQPGPPAVAKACPRQSPTTLHLLRCVHRIRGRAGRRRWRCTRRCRCALALGVAGGHQRRHQLRGILCTQRGTERQWRPLRHCAPPTPMIEHARDEDTTCEGGQRRSWGPRHRGMARKTLRVVESEQGKRAMRMPPHNRVLSPRLLRPPCEVTTDVGRRRPTRQRRCVRSSHMRENTRDVWCDDGARSSACSAMSQIAASTFGQVPNRSELGTRKPCELSSVVARVIEHEGSSASKPVIGLSGLRPSFHL